MDRTTQLPDAGDTHGKPNEPVAASREMAVAGIARDRLRAALALSDAAFETRVLELDGTRASGVNTTLHFFSLEPLEPSAVPMFFAVEVCAKETPGGAPLGEVESTTYLLLDAARRQGLVPFSTRSELTASADAYFTFRHSNEF